MERLTSRTTLDVLGHSPPTVTKSIYVEATRRVQQDAVDQLGFLFDA